MYIFLFAQYEGVAETNSTTCAWSRLLLQSVRNSSVAVLIFLKDNTPFYFVWSLHPLNVLQLPIDNATQQKEKKVQMIRWTRHLNTKKNRTFVNDPSNANKGTTKICGEIKRRNVRSIDITRHCSIVTHRTTQTKKLTSNENRQKYKKKE